MTRHYNFRTTRETEWLDSILMSVSEKDRAKYIRELIIKGLINENKKDVIQTDYKCNTNVPQTDYKPNTNVIQSDYKPIEDEIPKKSKKNISNFL